MNIYTARTLALLLVVGGGLTGGETLTVSEAIRRAWKDQAGLKAGRSMVESRQAEAEAHRGLRLPTVSLNAQGLRTDEPMMAFGLKLNQARISPMDFDPSRLNHPDPVTGFGGSLVVQQALYAGGRIQAARQAGALAAQAEGASQGFREQEAALAVVEAYFGVQVAEQALRAVEDTRTWVQGLEAFVGARVEQGLMLASEAQRLRAFHAQVDAQRAEVIRQAQAARSGLGLLTGSGPVEGPLATPLAEAAPQATAKGTRGDLQAADLQARAAGQAAQAAKGSLRPEVGLELGAGTMRQTLHQGGNWTWAAVGLKWKVFSAPDQAKARAASAQARASEQMRTFKQQQAEHEIRVAREAVTAAEARHAAATIGLEAAEEARRLREARHREGLTPLTEVLDAEAAVQGARTLLLQSLYDLRIRRAGLDLATGTPIEGVTP
jgi:outer membrane protein TolC